MIAKAPRAAAQTGTVQFVARVTPSGGEDEPVRTLPFYLLSKSYADIQKEAEAASPVANQDKFIDALDVSKELKAWMKTNHRVSLSGEDFTKMLKADDIMNVPEFFTAYTERMVGDRTEGFPTPKYKLDDRAKDPAKYDRLVTRIPRCYPRVHYRRPRQQGRPGPGPGRGEPRPQMGHGEGQEPRPN